MAFVLRGEIDIEGRKGIATLRQVQGEAVKTTKAFEQGSNVNAKFAKMLLGINTQAAATHKALFLLARTSGVGLFGVAAVKAGIALGDTLMQVGQEAESAGKSLDKSFKAGLKATTAEGVQSFIESITDQIDKLRAKTEGFSLRRMLGQGIEKLTGIDLGLTPEEGLITAGEKEIEILKKRLEQRKLLEKALKSQEEISQRIQLENLKEAETEKLIVAEAGDGARVRRMMGSEQFRTAQKNLEQQELAVGILERQKKELESIQGLDKDEPAIKKISLEIEKQKVEVIKAQTQFINAQKKEEFSVLQGSRAGRGALASAQRRKGRQDQQEAFKREEAMVGNRQLAENAKRRAQGLPELNKADVRNMMAEEAVGLREIKAPTTMPSAIGEGNRGTGGLKAEMTAPPLADTMNKLLEEFSKLASAIQSAPLVTSGAGTA